MDCHWFNISHCRSCELLDKSYEATLKIKEQKLLNLIPDIGQLLKATVGVPGSVEGSRNKMKLAAFGDTEESIQFGFYDSAGNFKNLETCPLHMEGLNELLPILKTKLSEHKIIPYSIKDKKGELKYLILSKSASHGEFLIRFVLRSKESLDRIKKMAADLESSNSKLKVMTINIQPEHKAVMEGETEIVITEAKAIIHQFNDVFLTLGPRSFFQVTPSIASKLYERVGDVVKEYKIQSFLDLFCGVGAFSFFAAKNCPKVFGVEISPEAIQCAKDSIPLNKIQGTIDFEALDVEEFLKGHGGKYEAILVNPPRRGLNQSIVESLLKNKPKVLIYSSCNAETLARDYDLLKKDYAISEAQIFDMFPFTEHFETLMILNRRDA